MIVTWGLLFACMCAPADAQIVYSADGRLYEIGADGSDRSLFTTPTTLQASDFDPEWSPDGTQLAVVHQPGEEEERSRIDLLSTDGSSREAFTQLERGVFDAFPRWSPDGSRLVFTRFTEDSGDYRTAIVIRDFTGEERTLVRQRLDRWLTTVLWPEWSSDGQSVLYSRSRLDREFNFGASIYTVPADGGPADLLARDAHSPALSPDGSRIAFISIADRNGQTCGSDECSYNGELYVMDADGGNAQRLTRSKGDDMSPDWSADGSRIAFSSNRNFPEGYGHEIYSIDADGNCLTWLTNGTASSVEPTWRPAAVSSDPGGCGATPRAALIEVDLGAARAFDSPRPLWLGTTYRGLLLSEVTHGRHEPLFFAYSDCGRYYPRDCPREIQVMDESVCANDASVPFLGTNNERIKRRRRALVAPFGAQGGVTALTGGLEVDVFAYGRSAARAAFGDLRPFPRETPIDQLRAPAIPATLARQIRRVQRVHGHVESVAATAEELGLSRRTVRMRLANARALDEFGHRVREKRC